MKLNFYFENSSIHADVDVSSNTVNAYYYEYGNIVENVFIEKYNNDNELLSLLNIASKTCAQWFYRHITDICIELCGEQKEGFDKNRLGTMYLVNNSTNLTQGEIYNEIEKRFKEEGIDACVDIIDSEWGWLEVEVSHEGIIIAHISYNL